MNYYEHHIGDYDSATAHLSMLEDAAYSRLMRLYYRKELPIPVDVAEACRLIRAHTKEERKAVESVLREFFTLSADGWHQSRCDGDIERFQKKAERNREVGKLGGRPRKTETQEEPRNNHGGFSEEPKQNPLQTPDTRHQTPEEKKERSPVGSRLPADWVCPEDWLDYCRSERPELEASVVACNFADYWHAKAGAGARKADWLATWRTWVRKEDAPKPQGRPPPESFRAQEQRLAAERVAEASPRIARRMNPNPTFDYVDMETPDVPRLA